MDLISVVGQQVRGAGSLFGSQDNSFINTKIALTNVTQNAGYAQRLDEGADCHGALVTVEPDKVRDETRDVGGSLHYKISYWRLILQHSTTPCWFR